MTVILPMSRYETPEHRLGFYDAAIREIEATPGIMSASFGGSLPLDGWDIGQGFSVVGDPPVEASNMPAAHYQITGSRFFETLGIPIVRGRAFGISDTATAPPVCIVSEGFVRRYARGRDPLQLQVRVDAMTPEGPKPVTRQIVGVAHAVKETPSDDGSAVQIYVPLQQNAWYWSSLVVRTAGSARRDDQLGQGGGGARGQGSGRRPGSHDRRSHVRSNGAASVPCGTGQCLRRTGPRSWRRLASRACWRFPFSSAPVSSGLRMALGARQVDIVGLVLRDGLRITGIGLIVGLAGAFGLTRFLESLLFGVTPLDATTFAAVAGVLGVAALAASAAPALRAARADPAVTLRSE